ncbi:NADH-quinone oxidoreductase subunit L [Haloarculaceae archaeon H-GB2-1]|nr:NADH-quinone oxidoreductase subunit L [Haloarculaceae archaeon H-GB1-1]MEA5409039.1 NADH-quinone oxidoreductase subunit L [Haloarculaceae archaeon H-GB2-1]
MAAEEIPLVFEFAPAIAVLPALSLVVALFFGEYFPKKGAEAGILATAGSLVLSLIMLATVAGGQTVNHELYTLVLGVSEETFGLHLGILIDPLSALMLTIVSLISFLVHVFSMGYMNDEGETGLPRYYGELGLFTASMLAFVMADNILMAFMFFELVGLASYLLIGFWFRDAGPPSAAKKAFLVTRFGDYFFLVGVVGIFATFFPATSTPGMFAGEHAFPVVAEHALAGEATVNTFGFEPQTWFTILGLLVLGGVIGKSAQFPLHSWLPDAMEGPTPVSALIHAATMVAAGVYLVARMYGFYALSPTALGVIALTGGFTALFAATMGVVKQEIKQVLAYSTISQYGYIMLGLGGGGYVAAVFHLTTHAVFKALLFLGAGSVIIAMHHNENMWDMGGLKEKMPVTYYSFLSGSLALAGIIPFAGFWSKDEVLFETLVHGLGTPTASSTLLLIGYAFGLVAVFFTGFYTFRMVFLTFHGEPRTDTAEDPHGVRWNVKAPLAVLGVLAATVGFINMTPVAELTGAHIEFLHQWLDMAPEEYLTNVHHYTEVLETASHYEAAHISPLAPGAVSLALALGGAGLAYQLYGTAAHPEPHTEKLGSIRTLLMHNYYLDEFQVWLATGVTYRVARAANTFDQGVVDGVVNGVSSVSLFSGSRVRRIQSGVVSNYASLITLSLVLLIAFFGIMGGWF